MKTKKRMMVVSMIKEYWPEHVTKRSWEKLKQMTKEFDFILIGGWAVYLYTGLHKSKDIDIIIDLDTLYELKEKYNIKKNVHLKKYEIEDDGFDIDIYVPYFSELPIPVEDILNMDNPRIKGIKTVQPEVLLILKQSAFMERMASVKGGKDAIDLITLLYFGGVDLNIYHKYLKKYKLDHYIINLESLLRSFTDVGYTGIDYVEFKKWKKNMLKKIKELK